MGQGNLILLRQLCSFSQYFCKHGLNPYREGKDLFARLSPSPNSHIIHAMQNTSLWLGSPVVLPVAVPGTPLGPFAVLLPVGRLLVVVGGGVVDTASHVQPSVLLVYTLGNVKRRYVFVFTVTLSRVSTANRKACERDAKSACRSSARPLWPPVIFTQNACRCIWNGRRSRISEQAT